MSFDLLGQDTLASAVSVDPAPEFVVALDPATIVEDNGETSVADEGVQIDGQADDGEQEESDEDNWDDISKGRYFGAGDGTDEGPLCHNCKQAGHKKRDCPHQLCRSCGALDDHDTMRCPMTQRCYNCSRLGHVAGKCPEPQRRVGSYCRDCGSKSHLDRSCPQIWRLYLPATGFDLDGDWQVEAWCYNCAAKGHYGDDCSKPHRMRLIEQSAFCLANQPESRSQQAAREASQARQRRREEEDRQDDWFARNRDGAHHGSYHHNSFVQGNTAHPRERTDRPPPRGPRQDARYDPYERASRPIVTSERYPRGLSHHNNSSSSHHDSERASNARSHVHQKRAPASTHQARDRGLPTRGGKAYRGGGGRR